MRSLTELMWLSKTTDRKHYPMDIPADLYERVAKVAGYKKMSAWSYIIGCVRERLFEDEHHV